LELGASIQVQCRLTVFCSETRPNAKPENVMPHPKRRHDRHKPTEKLKTKSQRLAKLKELFSLPQADPKQHI